MRSPPQHGHARSLSPQGKIRKQRSISGSPASQGERCSENSSGPEHEIENQMKKLKNALRYLEGVLDTKTYVQLPGTASVVLECLLKIQASVNICLLDEHSSLLLSSKNQVNQAVSDLLQWADQLLMNGNEPPAQGKTGPELIADVSGAVKMYVELVVDKLHVRESGEKKVTVVSTSSQITQRNSYPDIPLTPKDRELFQKTPLVQSHSEDSILDFIDGDPPPKPPLRIRAPPTPPSSKRSSSGSSVDVAPPLPPKRRIGGQTEYSCCNHSADDMLNIWGNDTYKHRFVNDWARKASENNEWRRPRQKLNSASEWTSSSHSPESLSPHSASASSLDSVLNQSGDELDNSANRNTLATNAVFFGANDLASLSNGNPFAVYDPSIDGVLAGRTADISLSSFKDGSETSGFSSLPLVLGHSHRGLMSRTLSSHQFTEERTSRGVSIRQSTVSQTSSMVTTQQYRVRTSENNTVTLDVPPALPAKKRNLRPSNFRSDCRTPPHYGSFNHSNSIEANLPSIYTLDRKPPLPPKKKHVKAYVDIVGNYSYPSSTELMRQSMYTYESVSDKWKHQHHHSVSCHAQLAQGLLPEVPNNFPEDPPALPPKNRNKSPRPLIKSEPPPPPPPEPTPPLARPEEVSGVGTVSVVVSSPPSSPPPDKADWNALDELEVSQYLIWKKPEEDGPDIRGGPAECLVVHATVRDSKNDYFYQEAFLTTYRTFCSPEELVDKLLYRYHRFCYHSDSARQRAAKSTFSLLIMVVDDLALGDIQPSLIEKLQKFVCELVCSGELIDAAALRKKVLEKWEVRRLHVVQTENIQHELSTRQSILLNFGSSAVAEQMTLLDAGLFQKIEIPELLVWAQEQNEDRTPHLTTFTQHFNKMSYWARSQILQQSDAKDRERYVVKFLKIMKHLRRLNNFNSYLALLSALDSAPIRRLEWQKQITDGLKEYCELIDSSCSFRAYRHALADTHPPCIPYIGLVLQDLTFVHIGNPNLLPDGNINFSKRWQQFNILENMKRFKKCHYNYKRSEKIVSFFGGFDNHLSEEALWQISESIKPRGGKKKQES